MRPIVFGGLTLLHRDYGNPIINAYKTSPISSDIPQDGFNYFTYGFNHRHQVWWIKSGQVETKNNTIVQGTFSINTQADQWIRQKAQTLSTEIGKPLDSFYIYRETLGFSDAEAEALLKSIGTPQPEKSLWKRLKDYLTGVPIYKGTPIQDDYSKTPRVIEY